MGPMDTPILKPWVKRVSMCHFGDKDGQMSYLGLGGKEKLSQLLYIQKLMYKWKFDYHLWMHFNF